MVTLVFLPQQKPTCSLFSQQAAYSSWLLAMLQGHAWTAQRLPAAPIYAFSPTLSSCILAVLARAITKTVIISIIIIIIIIIIRVVVYQFIKQGFQWVELVV